MKTSDLIDLMTSGHAPVDTRRLSRLTWLMALLAVVVTTVAVISTIGFRPDLAVVGLSTAVGGKILLGAAVALLALAAFAWSLRPGRASHFGPLAATIPLALALAVAIFSLAGAPAGEWSGLAFGRTWFACLTLVPLYGLLPLAALIVAARQGAPVDLPLTGLLAGLASGGLATIAYSLHCSDDSAAFIGIWYGVATLASGLIGRLIAPAFLRW